MSKSFQPPYPGYDVLDKWATPSWNEQTRKVIAERLTNVPPRRFFTETQWAVLVTLCDRVIPQPERAEAVPIAPFIDAALFDKRGSGTRFSDMPETGVAWCKGLAAFDAEARHRHDQIFVDLQPDQQDAILSDVVAGEVDDEAWQGLPPKRFMRELVLKTIVSIYYVHPAAQSEIGFGGPASPRGYVRLEADRFDNWEAKAGSWPDGGTQ